MRTLSSIALIAAVLAFAPAARAAETRIGYIDLARATNEIDEARVAMAAIRKEYEEKQKQLDAKQGELAAMQADLEKQAAVLSEQSKQAKAAELDKRVGELRQYAMQQQQELGSHQAEVNKSVLEKVALLVKEIAEAEGFQMVLERSDAGVVWAQPALDLTNELVRKYNSRFPKAGAPPASKPGADPKAAPKAPAKKP